MEWVEEKYYWKKDKKINGTTTQNQITETTTDSQSYWNGCWKLKLLKQLLKTEITGIITQFFIFLEFFVIMERIVDTMKRK